MVPSATCGNGFAAFFFQKKSSLSRSYPFRVVLPSVVVSTVIRFNLIVRTSETRDSYYYKQTNHRDVQSNYARSLEWDLGSYPRWPWLSLETLEGYTRSLLVRCVVRNTPRIHKVIPQLAIQPLGNHLCGVPSWTSDDWHGTWINKLSVTNPLWRPLKTDYWRFGLLCLQWHFLRR